MTLLGDELQLRSRKLDYLQLQWLEKTTGVSAANWDVYVLKELIDNALDADESAGIEPIEIEVHVRYARDDKHDLFSLEIDVANRASFPLNHISHVFDLGHYASSKSGLNIPTRGKQGNALKTIAGIPYALRHFHYGDYEVARWPILIETDGRRHTVSYHIDEETDAIKLQVDEVRLVASKDKYNWIRVGIDRFVQSSPREIEELYDISHSMALFNPHVHFEWTVSIGEKKESWSFQGGKEWMGRFSGEAPISWYDVGQFRSLLVILLRSQSSEIKVHELVGSFPGFDETQVQQVCKRVPALTLREVLNSRQIVQSLYDEMISVEASSSRRITVTNLGGLGKTSMVRNIQEFFGTPQQTTYRRIERQDRLRPSCPFVLEVFGARFEHDVERAIWTGINNTRNYGDPFLRTTLLSPNATTHTGVKGLREFVESFGVSRTRPFVIAIHLICPNIRYQDFSKTFIDGTPFREKLEEALSEVLEELTRGEEEAERELETVKRGALKKLIPEAVDHLSYGGRYFFSLEQLIQAVRQLYQNRIAPAGHQNELPPSLETREAIQEYSRENPGKLAKLIRRQEVQVYLPSGNGNIATSVSSVTATTLTSACVNKALVFSDLVMSEVFVANNLLRRFDVAVLAVDGNSHIFVHETLGIVARWGVPLLLAHDATISGCAWGHQIQDQLTNRGIDLVVYDLGLTPKQGKALEIPSDRVSLTDNDKKKRNWDLSDWEQQFLLEEGRAYSLVTLSPQLLKSWFHGELKHLGISEKMELTGTASRLAALEVLRRYIEKWVIEQLDSELRIDLVIDSVVNSVSASCKIEELMKQVHFDSEDTKSLSWRQLLERILSIEILRLIALDEGELRRLIRKKANIT